MIEDPVVWRKREYNKIAEFIVNCTMDCREDLHEDCEPPLQYDRQRVNYICHSDGGTRAENCSAAAWYLEAVVTTDKAGAITFPVAMRGLFLENPVSPFMAEALALEDGLAYLAKFTLE